MPPNDIQFDKDPQTGQITKTEVIDSTEFDTYKTDLQNQVDSLTKQIESEQSDRDGFIALKDENITSLQNQLQTVQQALTEALKI